MNEDLNYDNALRVKRMEAKLKRMKKFIQAFLDNFEPCESCGGNGWNPIAEGTCHKCRGTGEQIESIGRLYVDLPNEARDILQGD